MAAISRRMKFKLGQDVTLEVSGETGRIVARTEYEAGEPTYLVRFKAADGCGREVWWGQSAIVGA